MNLLPVFGKSIGFGTSWSKLASEAAEAAMLSIFDARIMNRAISESGGEATNSANLGTVHYVYDDAKNNDFKVTLPYG